jgi:hypothetical protein
MAEQTGTSGTECDAVLAALARGGDGVDWAEVERHLATCALCAGGLDRLTSAIDEQFAASRSLEGNTVAAPVAQATPARVTPLPLARRRRPLWRSPRLIAVFAAAAATVAVFAGAVVIGSFSSGGTNDNSRKSVAVVQAPAGMQATPAAALGQSAATAAAVAAAATRPAAAATAGSAAAAARAAVPATAAAAAASSAAAAAAPSSGGNPLAGAAEADRRPEFVPSLEVVPNRSDHTYYSGEQIQVCLRINQPSRVHLSVLEGHSTFDLYDADSDPGSHCFPEKVGTITGQATLRVEVFYGAERVAREDFVLLPATPTPVP